MNSDFVLGQVRLALVAVIAWCGAKGYFTPVDSTLALALVTSMMPVLVPWGWSIYSNINMKRVPQNSVAIAPADVLSANPTVGEHVTVRGVESTHEGATIVRVVGCLLAAIILIGMSTPASAGPIADKIAADAQTKIAAVKVIIVADLEAARDDARANDDPASGCWIILLDHANRMPPKLMGVAHTVQRLRTLRRSMPAILDACAVVKEGAKQAILQIFGTAAGGVTGLAAMGL